MSGIPTPLNRGKAITSKLPGPTKKFNLPGPSTSSASTSSRAVKRPREDPADPEAGVAKRNRLTTTKATSSITGRSNRSGPTSSSAAKVAKPLPNSMITGRHTTATSSFRRPAMIGLAMTKASAMRDRTNLAKKGEQEQQGSEVTKAKKKRASWDVKGRMKDLESEIMFTQNRVKMLEGQNTELNSNLEEKETVVAHNTQQMEDLKDNNDSLRKEVQTLKNELKEKTEEAMDKEKTFKREIDDLEFSKSSLERKFKALEDELQSKMTEIAGLKTSISQLTSTSAGMEAELKDTKQKLNKAEEKVSDLTNLSSKQSSQIEIFEENERAFETERRKLHNTIQELKGNIRVFCRIRPLLGEEADISNGVIKHIDVVDEKSLAMVKSAESPNDTVAGGLKGKANRYDFAFDRVFPPATTQAQVFEEISQLVQSAIDGYHVCVFAYGQTGSGKTFTMEGGEKDGQEGMIPKTIEKIFEETSRLMEKGWTYKLEASFLEIYNEEIRDLLATKKNLKYDIKLGKENDGSNFVTNLHIEEVKSPRQISKLLQQAHKNRAVAATNCNERSSRSHSVFQMKIKGHNDITSESCAGMLNLVDLAGSERLKESGSEGARLSETKSINKSLANLGNVIMALAQKEQHIPYRNSKLTHLLQGSLGGNSKTLMFVNVSPREEYFGETINSLRFATKVNQCQIGTATKKIK